MHKPLGRFGSVAGFILLAAMIGLTITGCHRHAQDVQLFPAPGNTAVCPDTPLKITFLSAPKLGSAGNITVFKASDNTPVETIDISSAIKKQSIGGLAGFNYHAVILNGNEADIYLPNGALAYGTGYYVKVDPHVFQVGGSDFPGFSDPTDWQFTTKSTRPAAGATRLTVAADGTGDFCTVQGAVDFVPANNTVPTTIFLSKGTYTEIVHIADKNALTFLGEDRKQSIIAYANNNKFNNFPGVYHRGVFIASHCNDLTLDNLTIHDTTPHGGSQAEAIILNGTTKSRAVLTDVDLYSFQDTLQINGQAYLNNCYIEGDVDFMWGKGPCFFDNCHCYGTRSKEFYTQIRNPASNHGYVYYHCTFDGPPTVKNMYLSRIAPTVFPHSEVVLIDCVLGRSVGQVGWLLNSARAATTLPETTERPELHFWEFNSHYADGTPVDVSNRLPQSRQLTLPQDAQTVADYSNPAFVLGNGWNPRPPSATQPTTQP